jgi:hypothetical protein
MYVQPLMLSVATSKTDTKHKILLVEENLNTMNCVRSFAFLSA